MKKFSQKKSPLLKQYIRQLQRDSYGDTRRPPGHSHEDIICEINRIDPANRGRAYRLLDMVGRDNSTGLPQYIDRYAGAAWRRFSYGAAQGIVNSVDLDGDFYQDDPGMVADMVAQFPSDLRYWLDPVFMALRESTGPGKYYVDWFRELESRYGRSQEFAYTMALNHQKDRDVHRLKIARRRAFDLVPAFVEFFDAFRANVCDGGRHFDWRDGDYWRDSKHQFFERW
jgi:hypothetical protein